MASKSAAGKKKATSKERAAPQRKKPARPGPSSRRPKRKTGPSRLSSMLPFFTIWLVAAVVLGGLIYWGKTNKTSSRQVLPADGGKAKSSLSSTNEILKKDLTGQHPKIPEPSKPKQSAETPASPSQNLAINRSALHEEKKLASLRPSGKEMIRPPKTEVTAPLGEIAIVIDDFGQDLEMAKRFLAIPLAITFSILPFQAHSAEIASLANSRGHEVILHLPMEPREYPRINPGSGALLVSMSPDKIQQAVQAALDACPNISGVNNHMGSRFTENAASMRIVLAELQRRGLYFIDSFTTDKSVGYSLAKELNLPAARRDIFLDHAPTEGFVRSQIAQLIHKAKLQGSAVAIGHPYKSTYKILSEEAGRFRKERIEVVYSGKLVRNAPVPNVNGD